MQPFVHPAFVEERHLRAAYCVQNLSGFSPGLGYLWTFPPRGLAQFLLTRGPERAALLPGTGRPNETALED